ncbi:glycosyltransferase family 2 protein [Halpernia sp.]|uniref:glycosyltransferase family 2 protein n=1 Tax=Halpernia sp. TaxID=2782209 RepID=UPI003A8E63C9
MVEDLKIPAISVVMPVYNGEKFLAEAIESILNQTFRDFELLLINDGSTDKTEDIILFYKDSRIIYIKNEQNLGLIKTLNKGLDLSHGEFIARMDQDDISNPTRFEKQIKVFENNPKIGVCGTWFTLFGDNREKRIINHPESSEDIKISLLGYCVIGHPTVMFRREIIGNLRYDNGYKAAEDFEYWTRLSRITDFYNIPESLLNYRFHQTNISLLDNELQLLNSKKIIGNQLYYLGFEVDENIIRLCKILFSNQLFNLSTIDLMKVIIFAKEIVEKNRYKEFYNQKKLEDFISKKLSILFNKSKKDNWRLIPFLIKNRSELLTTRSLKSNIKLIAKIILKK